MIDLGINLFQEIAALGGGGGFSITNSLRFNDNDSAYLSRTPSVAGNKRTATISMWIKRGNLTADGTSGSQQWLWEQGTSDRSSLVIDQANRLQLQTFQSGASKLITTTSVIRDVSGWYHIVGVIDIDNATSADRLRLYINGSRISAFDVETQPSSGTDATNLNNTSPINIGRLELNQRYFDGYMAEISFIDGQALTADDFGQIDETTGEWSPKAYEGTYGTNGFYLPFNGNANDDSGNGNNWTENNLASTDYMIDTPTNNFSVLTSVGGTGLTLSEGNLEASFASSTAGFAGSTIRFSSSKWYFEVVPLTNGDDSGFGVTNPVTGDYYVYYGLTGNLFSFISGTLSNVSYGSTYNTGDIIGVSYDADTGDLEFYKNNVSQGVVSTILDSQEVSFFVRELASANVVSSISNFGADSSFAGNKTRQGNTDANGIGDFYYTPPTGYLALCTDNLPAPAIEQPETQFNVVTYTGNGTSQAITGVGFQPDAVWIKARSTNYDHQIHDSVRGAGLGLITNDTFAEANYATVTSFDSDGFTVDASSFIGTNASGQTYVAWCWKAGGTAVTNTDGTITSQVSANVDAGFSIVGWAGDGVNNQTIGHGLSEAPQAIITKPRNVASSWYVWTDALAATTGLSLNTTDAAGTFSYGTWGTKTSTTIQAVAGANGLTNVNLSGTNYIAYCFHSVEGFSKFGSYVGNGSADGPFVYTGFKPAFVMIKRADSTGPWWIHDSARNTFNVVDNYLFADDSAAEASYDNLDLLSNGFKLRLATYQPNASGGTFIYMAFAEHPFKEALAR